MQLAAFSFIVSNESNNFSTRISYKQLSWQEKFCSFIIITAHMQKIFMQNVGNFTNATSQRPK